jgi:hypothetical protein
MAKLPSAKDATTPPIACQDTPRAAAAMGADSASGSPVSSQCVQVFANNIHVSDCPDNANCSSVPSTASSRNRNSSASSEDSNAPIHKTPGAASRSRDISGVNVSGNSVATIMKNMSG